MITLISQFLALLLGEREAAMVRHERRFLSRPPDLSLFSLSSITTRLFWGILKGSLFPEVKYDVSRV
jgi:hypothetical protein